MKLKTLFLLLFFLLSQNSYSETIILNCTEKTISISAQLGGEIKSNYQNPNITIIIKGDAITLKSSYIFNGKNKGTEEKFKILKKYKKESLSAISNEVYGGNINTLQINLQDGYFSRAYLVLGTGQVSSGKCF